MPHGHLWIRQESVAQSIGKRKVSAGEYDMKQIKISDMHYDSVVKLAKKYRIDISDLIAELIEESYNSKVRR